ncbi:hypothetical protein F5882DRAFT_371266, partial [Hyaloscypha sp. PMI_1271]
LTRLIYDFRKARHNPPSPELFLESIKILLEGEPTRRLDSTSRIHRIINKRSTTIKEDITTIKE